MAKKNQAKAQEVEAPKGRLVPKEISLRLTKDQCLDRANKASQLSKDLTEAEAAFKVEEDEFKQARAAHKNAVKNLREQIAKLLAEVKAQAAESTENVTLVLNQDAGTAEYWFNMPGDGWKMVDSRPLEDNERQMSLVQEQVDQMPDEGQEVEEE